MNPILFSKTETEFTSNGLGRLFPVRCEVTEERNGAYEAEIEVTSNEKHFDEIENDCYVGLKVSDGSTQIFKIYSIAKTLEQTILLKLAHISYELSYIPIPKIPVEAGDASLTDALAELKTEALVQNPFNFYTDITSSARYSLKHPASCRCFLGGMEGSFLDKYHGEYKFDNYNVWLLNARGSNKGVTIRYGKNLVSLENEDSTQDVIDGLMGYWTDGTIAISSPIYRVNQGNKIETVDISDQIELAEEQTQPTQAQVNSAAQHVLASRVTSEEKTLKVSWYEDKTISEVQLCDTVNVIYEPYGINVTMKVTKTVWNVIEEHYESIELGEYKSFVKTLQEMSSDIQSVKYNDGQTRIRLEQTANGLEAEVTRATTAEGTLSSRITQNASAISLEVSRAQDEEDDIRASLDLKIDTDDDGTIVSLINGSADNIHFGANNMFTVDSDNFSIDSSGDVEVKGSITASTFEFNEDGGRSYLQHQRLGDGSTDGLRIVNENGSSIALGKWLWLRNDYDDVVVLSNSNFRPNSNGIDLGYSQHRWDWVYCENISCADPPWDSSSSDKRIKENFSVIDKLHDFYMSLEPLQYNFKEGVDFKDPELKHYGLIAQDVLSLYEKCYNTDKQGIVQKKEIVDDGTIEILGENKEYTINYNELHAYHIAMIQELRKEVDELKAEIKKLKGETE